MDPAAMSLADKIGLTLQGAASWQELQSAGIEPAKIEQEVTKRVTIEEGDEEEDLPMGFSDDDDDDDEEGANALVDEARTNALVSEEEATALVDAVLSPEELAKKLAEKIAKDARYKKKMERFNEAIDRDAGAVLTTIDVAAVMPGPTSVTWDRDPELLCCYNWRGDHETNTIFVPGEPAKWAVPTLPFVLEPDQGYQYQDYNYARQPRDPYSPMFHALSLMNPNYQFNDVDVLADRNNLRVLLEVCQGTSKDPFRLDLYLVHKTLVIVRKEARWWRRHNGGSRGCNFEKHFTKPAEGMDDATNHYRAIRYPMGPLNVVVRFEADAYDDGVLPDELTQSEATAVTGNMAERQRFTYQIPIQHLQKGHVVPTAQIVELKSKSHREGACFEKPACHDQLWFGRTSLLYCGPYRPETGVVSQTKENDTADTMKYIKTWEEKHQEALRKLVALLSMLRATLEQDSRPNHGVVLVRAERGGPLLIRKMINDRSYAVKHNFLRRHWAQQAPRNGAYRGQRGGNRGAPYASRGRGQFVPPPGYQQPNNPRGGGYPGASNGHRPLYTLRGHTERKRSPDYSRGRGNMGRRRSPDYNRGGGGSIDRRNDPNFGRLGYRS